MLREACFVTGAVVLCSVAVIGTGAVIGYAWWALLEFVVAPKIGTNKLFFQTAARILNERKAEDTNQLDPRSKWRWPLR